MIAWLFWSVAAVLGLIGIAMLVAGWELVRRAPDTVDKPAPPRVHSIDLNLGEAAAAPAAVETASPPTDSDARRRALAHAIERMSEPSPPAAQHAAPPAAPAAARAPTPRLNWEDTQPRVNLPSAERTPPA